MQYAMTILACDIILFKMSSGRHDILYAATIITFPRSSQHKEKQKIWAICLRSPSWMIWGSHKYSRQDVSESIDKVHIGHFF